MENRRREICQYIDQSCLCLLLLFLLSLCLRDQNTLTHHQRWQQAINHQPLPHLTYAIHINMDTQLIINQITCSFLYFYFFFFFSFHLYIFPSFLAMDSVKEHYCIKRPSLLLLASVRLHIIACFENKTKKRKSQHHSY